MIGMIALRPSPGYPGFRSVADTLDAALADLDALQRGGADAVLVENDFDQPHVLEVGPEVVAIMTRVTSEVVRRAPLPVGVEVLLNDPHASFAVAQATGARFIRVDFFVDRVVSKLGPIDPEPAEILAYRQRIGADQVLLLADLQVKYSELVGGPKPLEVSARQARAAGADAVVVTGTESGIGPDPADLGAAREGGIPVLIGSGLDPGNAPRLVPLADGAIVGTWLRGGPGPGRAVEDSRVRLLVDRFRS